MNELISQLHDIEGLDKINWWPLAIGWWLVIAVILLSIIAFVIWKIHKNAFDRSWKKSTLQLLSSMQDSLDKNNTQSTLTQLSELIRRIAIYKYGREQCAGLEGKKWLIWLTQNDPKKFNWEEKGNLLLDAPYAPPGKEFPVDETINLINAIREWVK